MEIRIFRDFYLAPCETKIHRDSFYWMSRNFLLRLVWPGFAWGLEGNSPEAPVRGNADGASQPFIFVVD